MKYKPLHPRSQLDWRPWPLYTPFLAIFAILCLILCILVELIVHACSATGCHVFGTWSTTEMPPRTYFAYNLLPTVLSLLLGLLWAIPHHDIMRLEPYFQMSIEGGATAADSMFLQYSYTLVLLVPIQAAKRKHYVVLLSSCIFLLMSFFITPLIAGVFDDEMVKKPVSSTATREPIYTAIQEKTLLPPFTFLAYDYLWLNASLPPFATPTYAVLPVVNDTELLVANEIWEADTTLFEAGLSCEEAVVTRLEYTDPTTLDMNVRRLNGGDNIRFCDQRRKYDPAYSWDDQGKYTPNPCDSYTTFATPWTNIAYFGPGNNTIMLAWAAGGDHTHISNSSYVPQNLTTLFCMISYYTEQVVAAFDMPSGEIKGVTRKGSRTTFVPPSNFGKILSGVIDAFGAIPGSLDTGVAPFPYASLGSQPLQQPDVDPQLQKVLGKRPDYTRGFLGPEKAGAHTESHSAVYMSKTYGLPGFALAKHTASTLQGLLNPQVLAQTYERSIQLLFALAVAEGMVDHGAAEVVAVTRHVVARGFVVNWLWARGAQGGLVMVAMLTIVLAILVVRRPCKLDGEPNSLQAALSLLSASPELTVLMANSEFHPPESLMEVLDEHEKRYILKLVEGRGPAIHVKGRGQQAGSGSSQNGISGQTGLSEPNDDSRKLQVEKYWLINTSYAVVFLLGFLIVAGLLVTAFVYSRIHNGLPTVAPANSLGYKLLFSYIPITAGMAIEPVLVCLGACHCMLGPYKTLKRGPAPSSKSLAVDYEKSPPHFQLLRSLRTGNITLAGLTIAILLSNVLAVTFAGLFSLMTPEFVIKTEVQSHGYLNVQSNFTEPAREMYYILSEHLSSNLSMPAWTTQEYYVLPFNLVRSDGVVKYDAQTLGIGIDIECGIVESNRVSRTCEGAGNNQTRECAVPVRQYLWSTITVDHPCWGYYNSSILTQDLVMYGSSVDAFVSSSSCPGTFFVLWSDPPLYTDMDEEVQKLNGNLILRCSVLDKVVELTAAVDKDDKVLSTTPIRQLGPDELAASYPPNAATDAYLTSSFIHSVIAGLNTENSGSLSYQLCWLSYLVATLHPSIVRDPSGGAFLPNPRYIVDAFEDIFRRLFAINMWINANGTISTGDHTVAPGTAVVRIDKVYVSRLMFYIAISILCLIIAVLVALYLGQERQPIGHLPMTLAGMYAHLYASNAQEECGQVEGGNSAERAKRLNELGCKYTYGFFANGKHHGVKREGDL